MQNFSATMIFIKIQDLSKYLNFDKNFQEL